MEGPHHPLVSEVAVNAGQTKTLQDKRERLSRGITLLEKAIAEDEKELAKEQDLLHSLRAQCVAIDDALSRDTVTV